MVGLLLVVALLFYSVLYSGLAELHGVSVGIWQSLTGSGVPTIGPAGGGSDLTSPAAGVRAKVTPGVVTGPNPAGAAIVAAARRWIGTPYGGTVAVPIIGGAGPNAMDCSGLVMRAYEQATGYTLPHNAAQIFATCVKLSPSAVSPGDIFICSINSALDHTGIVAGAGDYIDSTPSQLGVREHGPNLNTARIIAYVRPRFLIATPTGGHRGGVAGGRKTR